MGFAPAAIYPRPEDLGLQAGDEERMKAVKGGCGGSSRQSEDVPVRRTPVSAHAADYLRIPSPIQRQARPCATGAGVRINFPRNYCKELPAKVPITALSQASPECGLRHCRGNTASA